MGNSQRTPTTLRVTLVQTFVLENQLPSLHRNAVQQQIFACALAMEVVKPVIAPTENNSATLKTTDGEQVAIPAMVSRSVMMVLAVELLKLAVIRKLNSVKWIAVKTSIALAHIK